MNQTETKQTYGYHADKPALVKRLHRIEGQVRGIEKMVNEDRYCIDILTQIAAVNTALESLAFRILDNTSTTASPAPSPQATRQKRRPRRKSCSRPCNDDCRQLATVQRGPLVPARQPARIQGLGAFVGEVRVSEAIRACEGSDRSIMRPAR
jgi:DNA-binding FrmR family transcriptional regulator